MARVLLLRSRLKGAPTSEMSNILRFRDGDLLTNETIYAFAGIQHYCPNRKRGPDHTDETPESFCRKLPDFNFDGAALARHADQAWFGWRESFQGVQTVTTRCPACAREACAQRYELAIQWLSPHMRS